MNKLRRTLAVIAFASAAAQAQTLTQKLAPADLIPTALYGFNTASSQKVLAVGAPMQNTVYIYVRNSSGWMQSAELTAGGLGVGIAVSDDTVAVTGFTSAFTYKQQNGAWTQQAQLPGANGAIAMQKNIIAAGNGSNAVGVWEQDETTLAWRQVARFTGTPGVFTGFGTTIALDGNILVVGEPFGGSGDAHVYVRTDSGWSEQTILRPPLATSLYGLGLGVSGSTIAIGAPGTGVDDDNGGSVFVYVSSNGVWTLQATLNSPSTVPDQDFGTSLALIGNTLLVGAYESDDDIGNADVFIRNGSTWTVAETLFPDDGEGDQRFANNVTMPDPNTYVCGSPTKNVNGKFHAGEVYIYAK
jgi:FG-GAP repeat protein